MKPILGRLQRGFTLACFFVFGGVAYASPSDAQVEVVFTDFLDKHMERISAKDRERVLMEYKGYRKLDWFKQVISPDDREYSVPHLITGMMEQGLQRANPEGFDGRLVLKVDRLNVQNSPVGAINSYQTQMTGSVRLYDSSGALQQEHPVRATLRLHPIGSRIIGPVAAKFTSTALSKVFPDVEAPCQINRNISRQRSTPQFAGDGIPWLKCLVTTSEVI